MLSKNNTKIPDEYESMWQLYDRLSPEEKVVILQDLLVLMINKVDAKETA